MYSLYDQWIFQKDVKEVLIVKVFNGQWNQKSTPTYYSVTCSDYFQRLQELLTSFDSISSQTRYVASDVDTSAKARELEYKAQEKAKKLKKQKMNDASSVEV